MRKINSICIISTNSHTIRQHNMTPEHWHFHRHISALCVCRLRIIEHYTFQSWLNIPLGQDLINIPLGTRAIYAAMKSKPLSQYFWKIQCSLLAVFFLSFLFWLLLPTHCMCRGLLLHLITLNDINTLGRTPVDGGSALRRDLYLTTQNTHKRQT